MKSINLKKLILSNMPYLLFVYLFDKVGQAVRFAPGADFSGKLLSSLKEKAAGLNTQRDKVKNKDREVSL